MSTSTSSKLMKSGLLLAGALLMLSGCGDDPLAPFEPEVTNATDSFQLQATDVKGITLTREYTWQNTGTIANINQSTTVTGGSAALSVFDGDGTMVYAVDLADNGTFVSNEGASGSWLIRMELIRYSGTINFRAQKP